MLENGTFLANRYEITANIGTGGMSDVYRAKDHLLGRDVGVKVLKEDFSHDMTFVTKFRQEAQSAAGLEHPNIVNIYDVGSENGLYYIVMEVVEGVTLKTYIEKKGRLNYKEVISIAIQVARGIEAAHKKGIIHRDIKPQNIMISKDGKVKVTDFGIAKAVSSNTVHADMMGSVHYTSPEQARNGYVTYRSDIYSLGIVMYEMATGQVPFDGDSTVAVALQHLQSEMPKASAIAEDLPISVEHIIEKATMKSPDRRYQNMEELLLDLRKALVTPNEDFINIVPLVDDDKTKVITEDELNEIKKEAGAYEEEDEDKEGDLNEQKAGALPAAAETGALTASGDKKKGRNVEKIITIGGVIAAIIIMIIMIYVFGSLFGWFKGFGTNTEQTSQIRLPDVTGKSEEEAKSTLTNMGLKVVTVSATSDDYDQGMVSEQNPTAGKKVDKDSTVTLTISTGSDKIKVPDVTGQTEDAATKTLKGAGLTVNVQYQYSSSAAKGVVISTDPTAGSKLAKNSQVTLLVSQGTKAVQVPSLTGMTKDEASSALSAAKLTLGNVTSSYSDSVESGKVISQSPSTGQYIDPGTAVNIVISKGKETATYRFSQSVTNSTASDVTYVLKDTAGKTLRTWKVGAGKTETLSVENIQTSSGTLSWSGGASGSTAVSFAKQ